MAPRFPVAALALLLAAALALAGCTGDGGDGGAGTTAAAPATGDGPGPDAPTGNATEPARTDPVQVTHHLTGDGGLAHEAPTAGAVAFPNSMADFALGFGALDFRSEPAASGAWILEPQTVTLDLWVQSSVPLATQGVFDIAAWGGATTSMPLFAFATLSSPVMAPDTPTQVTLDLEFGDQRGVLVPAQESLRLLLATGMVQEGQLELLVGGDNASTLTVTLSNLSVDPTAELGPVASEDLEGTLAGGGFFNCGLSEDVDFRDHTVSVGANTTYLRLTSSASGTHDDITDLDIDLFDGGTRVAGGHTAGDEETVLLAGPTMDGLAGKELVLRVTTCSGGEVEYTVTVEQA